MKTYHSEVLIIGAGIAGIATALELLDSGKSVVLLDRDEPEALGGLAKESFGGMFFVDSPEQRRLGIKDSIELALNDWHSFAEFGEHDLLPKQWAQAYVERCTPDVYHWVRRYGVGFFPVVNWVERGEFRPGNSVPRFHMVWGTGKVLANQLISALKHHPQLTKLTFQFCHKVDDLIVKDGKVSGAIGMDEKNQIPFEAHAEHVVIASGGINGCLQKVRQHWHKDWNKPPEVILNGSHRFADGTGHDAAARAGANLTHLDKMWNYAAGVHHPRPRKPQHGLSLVPPRSALWLNWRGERMGPQPLVSGFDTRRLVTDICQQERAYSWQVMNHKIALKELAVSGSEFNPSIANKNTVAFLREVLFGNHRLVNDLVSNCEDFVVAQSVPELVEKMNALQGDHSVQLDSVNQAINQYDATIARGPKLMNDEQLRRIDALRKYRGDKVRLSNCKPINDAKALPLIAIREFIISRKSLGGIQTDLQSRVVSTTGQAMDGLYAVGEAAGFGGGGLHGLRALEGTFLGSCILSGRIAAQAIINTI